jgi:hypothetical protein
LSGRANGGAGRRVRRLSVLVLAALVATAVVAPATSQAAKVRVMSRNIYLGADLGPGTAATNLQELVNAAGTIINEVDANHFEIRAQGLAREIRNQNADLVGLQEAAHWRQADCSGSPLPPSATETYPNGDFLELLLDELNSDGQRYRLVVAQPEFDFQVWANADGNEGTAAPGCLFGGEFQGRLTMRDAILAKVGTRVKTSNAAGGHFNTLLQVTPGGVPIDVTRGWTRVDATVGNAPKFRFVNTHFEAFDSQAANPTNQSTTVGRGRVRLAQANDLIAPSGPASSNLPVVLLGDLNSDVRTTVQPGGFKERGTYTPLSCCLNSSLLTELGGGAVADFDHLVDHVMTNAPTKVKRVRSTVTGRRPVNGFWSSDHAGIASVLNIK